MAAVVEIHQRPHALRSQPGGFLEWGQGTNNFRASAMKKHEQDQDLGFVGSVEDIGVAQGMGLHEVVPSSALSKALAVPWLSAALEKEPPALDTALFGGPLNVVVTLQFVLQRTLPDAIRHSKPPSTWVWVESEEGARWRWTVGNRVASAPTMVGSSEVSERKHIKTSGGAWARLYMRWCTTNGPCMP